MTRTTRQAILGAALAVMAGCAPSESATVAPPQTVASAGHPVVIELFQSQGCSSCPPALTVLNEEAARPDVIALNFAVTYWDRLGWPDKFAKPEFTARQWDYAHAARRPNVQTPQLIVDGAQAVLGSRRNEVDAAIVAAAKRPRTGPALALTGSRLTVGRATPVPATVWLVGYDPRPLAVAIRAGENEGRTLVHRNIVRRLTALGHWTGAAASFTLPAPEAGLARAILVQRDGGGPVLAARKV